jgi:hypothetical protein
VHRAGRSHVNADALSRRPCYESACKLCSGLEDKDNENETISEEEERGMRENGISRGVTINKDELLFKIWTKEELRTKQVEDPDIRQIMEWKINGRPEWKDISAMSPVTKSYWAQWASIAVVDGILYRRSEDASGREVKYLYLTPRAIQYEVLRNLHDYLTAGHFGMKKTLARVRQRFYWMNLRWSVENWFRKGSTCWDRFQKQIRETNIYSLLKITSRSGPKPLLSQINKQLQSQKCWSSSSSLGLGSLWSYILTRGGISSLKLFENFVGYLELIKREQLLTILSRMEWWNVLTRQ